MRHTLSVRPHATTFSGLESGTRFAHPYTFLLLWLCAFACAAIDTHASGACVTPTFAPASVYGAGPARHVAVADFNRDGKLDFAALKSDTNSAISFYLGDGAGAFAPSGVTISLGTVSSSIGAGDFDSDGYPDLVVANSTHVDGEATLFLNHNLAFDVRRPISWSSASFSRPPATSLAVADLNFDGKLDVVTTTLKGDAKFDVNKVNIAFGDGAGHFSNLMTYGMGNLFLTHAVVRDFNSDGQPDIAVAYLNVNAGSGLLLLIGDGTDNFNQTFTDVSNGILFSPDDFNSDNKVDLAFLSGGESVPVRLGDGAGGFGAATFAVAPGLHPNALTTGDFDGDGRVDLAVVDKAAGLALIFKGDGAGNFTPSAAYNTGASRPSFIDAADFDADGRLDLVVAHESAQSVSVLLNTCGTGNAAASLNFSAPVYEADERAASGATVTVNRYGSLAGEATVNYSTSDGTAVHPSDYKAATGVFTFADGEVSKTFTVELVNDTLDEPTETVRLTLSNPTGTTATPTLVAATLNILDDDPTTFSVADATAGEGDRRVTLTVTRTGDGAIAASVDYRTSDTDTFTVGCADTVNNAGGAYARCDFATTVGRLDFAAGELQKTINIPLIDDGHKEAAETFQVVLSNPSGAGLGANSTATVTISDNDAAGAANPIFTTPFFVRQHYVDFLSREPEASEPWSNILNRCLNDDRRCDRITVSQSFFGAPEFSVKGLYVFRFYKVAFGSLPEYTEIISDMSFVAGQTPEEVYARKAQLAQLFTERAAFKNFYGGMDDERFVSALLSRYQLTEITTPDPAQPDGTTKVRLTRAALINSLDAGTLARAQVFRAIADSDTVGAREFDNAFVAMQYYGYLRRKPDADGYAAWLAVLQRGDTRTMVAGFLNSPEYKLRFGN
ncbi:MAG TPA: FG-GAP-like repeat-containing protein [Pyrinomonadaceae bacterium]|jgi:hypothetical protein